jgi:hypothetical protein
VLTVFSPNEEVERLRAAGWRNHKRIRRRSERRNVWVNTTDRRVQRDEDGTYVTRID